MYNCVLYINQVSVKIIDGNTVAMFPGLPMLGRAVCHRALPIPAFEFVLALIYPSRVNIVHASLQIT